MIHPTAIISPKAELHETVEVGPYTIIEENVTIGEGTHIASGALIASGARIGKNVRISHGAVIGTLPQDLKFGGEETIAVIGDNTVLREYVTVNRGTRESGSSDVGRDCFLMAYAHVAHDCKLGDHVIMANSVNLGGHVHVDRYAIIGGLVPVHQFVRIGAHCMIGGGFRAQQDICPYSLVGGHPLKVIGLNQVGLKRRNFSKETIQALQKTFKILFFSRLNTTQALERLRVEVEQIPEVQEIITFVETSPRGMVK
ncbi:MAG: acyl-ACP--UDP-N-acetylglucosamine O-acyltransferase [candidate division Zixibacteria bacterium]|nr:acyl-ACP--UDP-N-acetylglucosamine O-acyltransferase [candidate division Zixibacteria bacterium]